MRNETGKKYLRQELLDGYQKLVEVIGGIKYIHLRLYAYISHCAYEREKILNKF